MRRRMMQSSIQIVVKLFGEYGIGVVAHMSRNKALLSLLSKYIYGIINISALTSILTAFIFVLDIS